MGYAFVLLTVVLTAAGQLLIKWQVDQAAVIPTSPFAQLAYVVALLGRPWVLLGLAMAFAASLSWMLALTRLPLSAAYPFTALALVTVVASSAWLFGEPVSTLRLLGLLVICAGIVLVGLS
jgi:multidrug transporter EmrE-like cation transporter